MTMARHDLAHARQRRQPFEASPIVAERIGRVHVEQRYLHVGAHVAGDKHAAVRQEHGAMARRVPGVNDEMCRRAIPRNGGSA